jgi:hypothetical protein
VQRVTRPRLDVQEKAQECADRFLAGASIIGLADEAKCCPDLMRKVLCATIGHDVVVEINSKRRIDNFGNRMKPFKRGNKVGHRFTDGCLRGVCARKWVPIGTKKLKRRIGSRNAGRPTIRKYWAVKVSDEIGSGKRNWESLAAYNYKKHIGPIPDGHCVIHRNGDSLDDSPENLVLVQKYGILQYLMNHRRELIHSPKWRKNLIAAIKMRAMHRRAMNRIRETIPVPSCVTQSMESGWWDNRDEEDEEDV